MKGPQKLDQQSCRLTQLLYILLTQMTKVERREKKQMHQTKSVIFLCLILLFAGCGNSGDSLTFANPSSGGNSLSGGVDTTSVGTRLGFISQPARAGDSFASFQVGIFDETGTLVPDNGVQITLSSPSVTLLGQTVGSTSLGVATFSNVSTETAASVTITATAPGLQSATSTQFVVGPADPEFLSLSFDPGDLLVGQSFNFSLLVTDRFGNPIPGLAVSVEALEAGVDIPVPTTGSTSATTNSQGVVTFNNLSVQLERTVYLQLTAGTTQARSNNFNVFNTSVLGRDFRVVATENALLKSVVVGGGLYLAVGDNGGVRYSSDGLNFESASAGFSGNAESVAYGNGLFVAVGQGGVISTSPDGSLWTLRDSKVTVDLQDITFANGLFVAVGDAGTVVASPNGIDWTAQSNLLPQPFFCVTFGNGLFVIVPAGDKMLTSTDGLVWTEHTKPSTGDLLDVAYGPNGFVAVGPNEFILHSSDGTDWTVVRGFVNGEFYHSVIYFQGQYVVAVGRDALAGNPVHVSTDGLNFTPQATSGLSLLNGLASDGTTLYGVGLGNIYTTSDLTNWQSILTFTEELQDLLHTGQEWLGVADDAILFSPDGQTWNSVAGTFPFLLSIARSSERLVVVGEAGSIFTSEDGRTWTARTSMTSENLWGVCFGDSGFVGVGDSGNIVRSTDGISWTAIDTGNQNYRDVTFAAGLYVAVVNNQRIYTSPDGDTWTRVLPPGSPGFLAVKFLNNQFVAVGSSGVLATSDTGVTWTVSNVGVSSSNLRDVTFLDGTYYAVGGTELLSSTDLVNWTLEESGITNGSLLAIEAITGQIVAAGTSIIVSP